MNFLEKVPQPYTFSYKEFRQSSTCPESKLTDRGSVFDLQSGNLKLHLFRVKIHLVLPQLEHMQRNFLHQI